MNALSYLDFVQRPPMDGFKKRVAEAFALRRSNPARMLEAMEVLAAEARDFPAAPACEDLRAWAWGHLGNARRVANRLPASERALGKAWTFQAQGTGDRELTRRLYEFQASLFEDNRRFPEALAAIDAALQLHERDAARAAPLVQKASIVGHSGDAGEAVCLIREALDLIVPQEQRVLAQIALHNLSWFLCDLGLPQDALSFLQERQKAFPVLDDDVPQSLRVRWLEGRILSGLGEKEAATDLLESAVRGFSDLALPFDAVLCSLELAHLHALLGRWPEVRCELAVIQPVLTTLGVRREDVAATLLRRVSDLEGALKILPQVSKALRRSGNRRTVPA